MGTHDDGPPGESTTPKKPGTCNPSQLLGSSASDRSRGKQIQQDQPNNPRADPDDEWGSTDGSSPAPSEHVTGLYNPRRVTKQDCLNRFGAETLEMLELMAQRASSRSASIYRKELSKIYGQFMELQTVKEQIQELVHSNVALEDGIKNLYAWALGQYSEDGETLTATGEAVLEDLMDQLKEVYARKKPSTFFGRQPQAKDRVPSHGSGDARVQENPNIFSTHGRNDGGSEAIRYLPGVPGFVTAPEQRTTDDLDDDEASASHPSRHSRTQPPRLPTRLYDAFVSPDRPPTDQTAPTSAKIHPRFSAPDSGGTGLRGGSGRGRRNRDEEEEWPEGSQETLAQVMSKLNTTLSRPRNGNASGAGHSKHLKPKEDIGTFSGEKSELLGFVQSVQMVLNTSGVDDQVIAKMLPICLVEDAQSWFRGLPQHQQMAMVQNCDAFVRGLCKEYPTQSRAERRAAIDYHYNPKEHKSIRTYYYNKVEKMRAAEPGISEEDLVEEIHRGLAPHAYPLQQSVNFRRVSLAEFKEELIDKFEVWTAKSGTKKPAKTPWLDQQKAAVRAKRETSPDKTAPVAGKRKVEKPSDLPNGRGCIHCNEDHWDRECTSEKAKVARKKDGTQGGKKKSYNVTVEVEEDSSESEYDPMFTVYACSTYISKRSPPFNCSRIIPIDENVTVSALPRREIVGTGRDFLSASPLPIEVFLEAEHSSMPINFNTARVCVDTGGQGLIDREFLRLRVPDAVIMTQDQMTPRFCGVGGAKSEASGFVVLEVFFPNQDTLVQGASPMMTRISIEFQVVDSLDCNALIGREVLRHHGINIIEDREVIQFPDGNEVPIINFDCEPKARMRPIPQRLYAASGRYVRPGQEVVVEIRPLVVPSYQTLMANPTHFDRRSRFIGGMMPRSIIRGDQRFVTFRNFSSSPIRIPKGEPLATLHPLHRGSICHHIETSSWESVIPGLVKLTQRRGDNGRKAKQLVMDLIQELKNEGALESDAYDELLALLRAEGVEQEKTEGHVTTAPEDEDRLSCGDENRQGDFENPASDCKYPPDERSRSPTHQTTPSTRDILTGLHPNPLPARLNDETMTIRGYAVDLEIPFRESSTDRLGLTDEFPDPEMDTVTLQVPETDQPPHSNPKDTSPLDTISFRINPRIDVQKVTGVLERHLTAFGFEGRRLGTLDQEMTIDAVQVPPAQAPYRESPRVKEIIAESMKVLRQHDIIEPSNSPTASPVVVVKQHGKHRFCVDFRKLNDYTAPVRYPLPRPDSIFNALSGKRYFTTMDANKGYHQFSIAPQHRHLTAFTTESQGLWQYKRVPFGLKNAPSFFQAAIDAILGSMRWDFVLAYIDDVIIYSNTFEDHLRHLDAVLMAVKDVGMTLDERKCFFAYESLSLLGHRVNRLGLMTQPEKVRAIQELPFPRTVKGLQNVLGQFTYYRQFIEKFALIAAPLFAALKLDPRVGKQEEPEDPKERARRHGRQVIEPNPKRLAALDKLKELLSSAPVLRHPEFEQPFFLHTDGCGLGLAATLEQEFEGKRHPILYISRSLKPEESRYTATEIECLAVYWALHKLAPYVDGCSQLTLITDHSALKWIWNISPTTNSRLHRWSLLLGPLKDVVRIEHRPGRLHSNVDPLSRHPITDTYHGNFGSKLFEQGGNRRSQEEKRSQEENGQSREENDSGRSQEDARQNENDASHLNPHRNHHLRSYHSTELSTMATADFIDRYRQAWATEETEGMAPEGLVEKDELRFKEKDGMFRLYVPASMREEVMRLVHDGSAHPGKLRSWVIVKSMFWWRGARKQLDEYIKTCHRCQMEKARHERPPGSLQPIISPLEPFHTIAIDFIDALPKVRGFSRLATITCKGSKAVIFIPLKEKCSAEDFAQTFIENVYPRWGLPVKIISDRDTRFTSNFWKALMSLLHVRLGMTTASHPQADGQSERTNRTLEIMVRSFIFDLEEKGDPYADWVRLLPIMEFEHNMTMNTSTGFSPFDLLYSSRPRRPLERALLQKKKDEVPVRDAWTLSEELETRRRLARRALKKAQAFQKKYYDQKRSEVPEFREGEKVVFLPYDKAKKLDPHGRCVRIKTKISPLAYRITRPLDSPRMHDVVSIDYLRKYFRRGKTPEDPVTPTPSESESEERGVEEIDRIIGERQLSAESEKEYLVRWKDFDEMELSWLKASELKDAEEALREWMTRNQE